MTVKIVGIDPGLAATGIGVITGVGQKVSSFAYGVFRTSQTYPLPDRLEMIYTRLGQLLREERPDLLIIEDIFSLEQYPQSGITLGKVCGVIILAVRQAAVTMQEIPVRQAKQVLTGNGAASKMQLEKAVRQALGMTQPIHPSHASDALGLALIGLFRYGNGHRKDRQLNLNSTAIAQNRPS
jgi:crossover junction endodeoxyribonuclease RuvC